MALVEPILVVVPEVMMEEFRETMDEWVGKVEGITTREELRDLYWKEVFSRVDVNSYGM